MYKEHQFKKSFGQNFLTNEKWIDKMLDVAKISSSDTVLEIGPGDGRVTEKLLKISKKVISVEIDTTLIDHLKTKFIDFSNFKIINQDILQLDLNLLEKYKDIKIIGSLPYNISKKIIKLFLESTKSINSMVFIVQREVAESYTAKPPNSTFLNNYVRLFSDVTYHGKVPKEHFYPKPKVDGGIIKLILSKQDQDDVSISQKTLLKEFIRLGFSQPRKKLSSLVSKSSEDKIKFEEALVKLGYQATARAQEINFEDWERLKSGV